ncbi:YciI family protein [Dyella koreensis]|uniref:YciI family protein n=1 Tax=Dyella koreensis TaxID=311235 RepID=A0ABW8KAI2_9GAMM
MRYVCLIYFDPKKMFDGSAESNAVLDAAGVHGQTLKANGQLIFAQPLALPGEAMTVQVRDAKMSATDGPFMETKEMLGGLVVIEAPDLNAAVQIAAGMPFATRGSIEVRPVPDYTKPRPVL